MRTAWSDSEDVTVPTKAWATWSNHCFTDCQYHFHKHCIFLTVTYCKQRLRKSQRENKHVHFMSQTQRLTKKNTKQRNIYIDVSKILKAHHLTNNMAQTYSAWRWCSGMLPFSTHQPASVSLTDVTWWWQAH